MPSETDRRGKLLPSPVVPPDTVCFMIQIPNAVQYRAAFLGQINILGVWETWDHPTNGTDCIDCEEAAQLWRNAIYNATWSDECGVDPMSCEDVADCIETNDSVKQAIQAVVPYTPIEGMTYPPGVPLTPSQMTTRLNEIDDCVYDAYWAQCEQFIDYMINLGQDVLDQIAAYSAALDAGENVPMGQFLGKLKNSSTAGKVIDFLQWVLTVVKAQYEAADNAANRDALKCAVFCAGKDDCLITIQGTLDVLNTRLGGLLTPGDLDDMVAMVDAFMTAVFNPALALDLWVLFLMGSAKTAGMFGLQGIDETLNMVLVVAVNDANNDWETKCEDCDEPPPDPACVDFAISRYTWDEQAGGTYDPGTGFRGSYSPFYNSTVLRAWRDTSGGVASKVVYKFNTPVTNVLLYQPSGGFALYYTGSPSMVIEFSADTFPGSWANVNLTLGLALDNQTTGDTSGSIAFVEACIYLVE